MTTPREPKTPDWLLERLAQGELDAADVRARLVAEGRSPEDEIAALRRADRDVLAAHPPADVAAEIRRRAATGARVPTPRPTRWVFGAGFAVAGSVAAIVAGRLNPPTRVASQPAAETTTIKGTTRAGAQLYVYRHQRQGDERLADGERVAPGDLLQLAYTTAEQGFGVMLSIDGAGAVTQHWPEPGAARAAVLRPGGEVRLPSAYELDAAPVFERFFLVKSAQPFEVAPIIEAARQLSSRRSEARRPPLPLPDRFEQVSLALEKTR
jgi:hypothetical protein